MLISSATFGKEAMDILTQVSFDLVITKLNMPGMNGIDMAGNVIKQYPTIPVLLLNALGDDR